MSYNEDLIRNINDVMDTDNNIYEDSSVRVEQAMLDLAQLMTGETREDLRKALRIGDLPEDLTP